MAAEWWFSGIYKFHHTPEILYARSLYSSLLLIGILSELLQNGVFWDINIPPQQRFYIPEPYNPEGSLLGSCTDCFRIGCWSLASSPNHILTKPKRLV